MMKPVFKRIIKIVVGFHVLLLFALVLTHCTYTHYAKKSYALAQKEKPYDVIIVPGIPYDTAAESSVMRMRVFWAKYLYDSGITRNIIFSGSSVYSPYVEGVVMKIMADSLGVPPDHTFSETKAEHSTENIYYSWVMAKNMGYKKIALATDPYQAGLLRGFIKRYCPGMRSVPIIFGAMDIGSRELPRINPESAYTKNFVSITERQGFWERFKGTRGMHVKELIEAERREKKSNEGKR